MNNVIKKLKVLYFVYLEFFIQYNTYTYVHKAVNYI